MVTMTTVQIKRKQQKKETVEQETPTALPDPIGVCLLELDKLGLQNAKYSSKWLCKHEGRRLVHALLPLSLHFLIGANRSCRFRTEVGHEDGKNQCLAYILVNPLERVYPAE